MRFSTAGNNLVGATLCRAAGKLYPGNEDEIPLEWASIHYYQAPGSNRSDPASYSRFLFGGADEWFVTMAENMALRNQLAPNVKMAMTELGTLVVDDMSRTFGNDGGLPDDYFRCGSAPGARATPR
jgi:hypothetical protein